jgi:DNA-binding NarL/FixJ family response regulator
MSPDKFASFSNDPLRILIVDDNDTFRDGLRTMLRYTQDARVVGEAVNGQSAIESADALQPDVILMDIQLAKPGQRGMNGIEATQRVLASSPHIAVLMLSMHDDNESVFSAMRAGARGYVLKGADGDEIMRAVRAAANGEAIFSPAIARRMIEFFSGVRPPPTAPKDAFPELTAREREILESLSQGRTNQQIAEQFVLSPRTVRNHLSNIFSKLQVTNRAQAIILARDHGMSG